MAKTTSKPASDQTSDQTPALDVVAEELDAIAGDPNASASDGSVRLYDGKVLPPAEWSEYTRLAGEYRKISKIAASERTSDQSATVKAFSKAYNQYKRALNAARKAGLIDSAPVARQTSATNASKRTTIKGGALALALGGARIAGAREALALVAGDTSDQLATLCERYASETTIPGDTCEEDRAFFARLAERWSPKAKRADPVAAIKTMDVAQIASALTPEQLQALIALAQSNATSAPAA